MRHIVKLDGMYFEWSTIVDAPTTGFRTREQIIAYLEEDGCDGIEERLARADQFGTSCRRPTTAEEIMICNRAGPNESRLTLDEMRALLAEDVQPVPTKEKSDG